jgi:hypothetical protein
MAMIASKGPEAVASDTERAARSVVEEPRRSPAPRVEEVVDWTWEAEKSLFAGQLIAVFGEMGWRERTWRRL